MRIIKNRIFIAVACIVLAAAVAFLAIPALNRETRATVTVIRAKGIIPSGMEITPDLLTTAEVGEFGLPSDVLTDNASCVGLYSAVTILPTDNLTPAKFAKADDLFTDNIGTRTDKLNISVEVPSLAAGVSGKLAVGDVIRIYAAVETETGYGVIQPEELEYLEVVAVTNSKALDTEQAETSDAAIAAAVTVTATDRQARTLVSLQATGKIHIALIGRDAAAVELLNTFNTDELPAIEQYIAEAEALAAELLAQQQAMEMQPEIAGTEESEMNEYEGGDE